MPYVPNAPTGLKKDDTNTTDQQVAFSWAAPSDGGNSIIDYTIYLYSEDANSYIVA